MKKLIIIIILIMAFSAFAQTSDKEALEKSNENVASAQSNKKYGDAIKFAHQSVDLSLKIYGDKNRLTAIAYENLGLLYREDKKYKLASENLQKAIEIYQKDLKQNGTDLASVYEKLALAQLLDKQVMEAETSYLKAIEIAESISGSDSKEVFQPTLSTAVFYAQRENVEKSLDYFIKSYALAIKNYGKESNEFETANIYQKYFLLTDLWNKDFIKKKSEIVGYEIGGPVSLPRATYPKSVGYTGRRGKIVVKVLINEKGKVIDATAVFGEMYFARSAENAARGARFKPSIQNGKPIKVSDYIVYRYES